LGSGNPGMSNVWRTMGARWAAVVLAADAGRGMLVAFVSQRLFSTCPEILAVCLAVVAGNLFPIFHGFRGGKGFGASFGIMLAFSPVAGLLCGIGWVAVARLLRMASIATLCAAASYPVLVLIMGGAGCEVAAGVVLLAVTVFTHRQNIARLARGSEHRL
ncbi:MAG: glycerol-3-phosphate acyltransferase, partial [Deltaproteobacteria bacterium]